MIQFPIQVSPMGAVRMTQRSKWKDESAKKYLQYKNVIGMTANQHIKSPIINPVSVTIAFYYPIPKAWSKEKKESANDQGIMPTGKPDIDNCIKGVFDALNGIAWKDDSMVIEVKSFKRYAYNPMIVVTINEVSA